MTKELSTELWQDSDGWYWSEGEECYGPFLSMEAALVDMDLKETE